MQEECQRNNSPGKMEDCGTFLTMVSTTKEKRQSGWCSIAFQGTSLNSELLQGPDLTITLLGVLLRFQQEPVAVMEDTEGMFHQVTNT